MGEVKSLLPQSPVVGKSLQEKKRKSLASQNSSVHDTSTGPTGDFPSHTTKGCKWVWEKDGNRGACEIKYVLRMFSLHFIFQE